MNSDFLGDDILYVLHTISFHGIGGAILKQSTEDKLTHQLHVWDIRD